MRCIRKISALLLPLILAICFLPGCTRPSILNFMDSRDTKDFREMMDKILLALDHGDKDELKSLFSPNAIHDFPDFDKNIQAFFNHYSGFIEIEKIDYSASGSERIDHGKRQTRLHNTYDITFISGKTRYHIDMAMYSRDDFQRENEGVHILEISTDEAHQSKSFVSYVSYNAGPGFYFKIRSNSERIFDLSKKGLGRIHHMIGN